MERNRTKGYLLATGASLALAGSFIFSKSVLNQLTIFHFGLLWFTLGTIWNGAWFLARKEFRKLVPEFGIKSLTALTVAILEGGATGLFYLAIEAMENPAVVSFIGNIGPVFVTLMGMTLLGERFQRSQQAGIAISIIGLFVIHYRQGGFMGFLDPGSLYVIGASLLFALATIVGRHKRQYLVPGYMSLIRTMVLAGAMLCLYLRESGAGLLEIQGQTWRDLLLGSLLETLIVIVFAYQALKLIEATKTSLIISLKSVWTLLLAWIFMGIFPTVYQLSGGILMLFGVWFITWDRSPFRSG
jgi:drug/metabolite transporter (DMT)-like permease